MKRCLVLSAAAVICSVIVFCAGGCLDSADDPGESLSGLAGMPFLVTVNADTGAGTGSYSLTGGFRIEKNIASFDTSDLGVAVWNDSIFIYGKYMADWLARFSLDNPDEPLYQYSTVGGSESTMNPSDVVIVNNDTGYVLRYASSVSWIIDPSPEDEPSFKTGEIDLSDYETEGLDFDMNPCDYPPNPVQAVVRGNTMYLLLERSNGWAYDKDALLLTLDISVPSAPAVTDEFTLIVRSPNVMQLMGNSIYIAGWGMLGWSEGGQTPTGGIEKVDISAGPGSYTSGLLVDDDDGSDSYGSDYTYGGAAMDVAVLSSDLGYIYFGEWNVPVYRIHPFNPSTGEVYSSAKILDGVNIAKIAPNPAGNITAAAGFVSRQTQAGIYEITYSSGDYSVTGPVSVGLEPTDFDYND